MTDCGKLFTLKKLVLAAAIALPAAALVGPLSSSARAGDAPPPPRRPIMGLLDKAGLAKPLDDARINIFGHVEGSYMYNFNTPDNDINNGRVFDFEHDEPTFNQANLTIERAVEIKPKFDIGGRVEMIYGADAGLIHSNGLFDWYDGPRDPENQFDLNQLYADVVVPVGNGLRLRIGKFVTLIGVETINPTTNAFYSHTFLFGFAIPFTHTGILGTYNVNDKFQIHAGVTRGWEQSWEDNNSTIDFLGGFTWTVNDKFSVAFYNSTGPQQTDDNDNIRTLFNLILTYKATDKCTLTIDGVYGWEEEVPGLGDSDWYGIAVYGAYVCNDAITFNARGEWFNDDDGARGFGTTLYEATLGLTITPFPKHNLGMNLKIRPEIRYDYSEDDIFDAGSENDQFTAGLDIIFLL